MDRIKIMLVPASRVIELTAYVNVVKALKLEMRREDINTEGYRA